jgi:ERCC4-type nuclease
MSICKIDIREHSLHESLRLMDISFEPITLDIGDIDIQGIKGQRFLFERKTVEDLAASLRDGRFKEQKDRLLGVLQREPMTAIAYIIEGRLGFNLKRVVQGRVTVGSLVSLLNTLQLRYRIPVVFTGGVSETAIYIQCIMNRLCTEPDFCPVSDGSNAGCFEHTSLLPKIASNRKTDRNSILSSMLTAIPNVSHKISSFIIEWFDSKYGGLIKYVKTHPYQEFEKELLSIKISGRTISKKIRDTLFDVLYGDDENIRISSRSSSPDILLKTAAPPLRIEKEKIKKNPRKKLGETNERKNERFDGSIPLFVDDSPVLNHESLGKET